MTQKRKQGRKASKLISSTRPKAVEVPSSLSSHGTRLLIQEHHRLRRQLKNAKAQQDRETINEIEGKIKAAGGIRTYQFASIQGQSVERGGDSSKVLVEWFKDLRARAKEIGTVQGQLKLLEIGALKVDNAYARSKIFTIERIDLHSQHPMIKQQDFMKRPTPDLQALAEEGFDVISLSLVLNFVDEAVARGAMLDRIKRFLRRTDRVPVEGLGTFPFLFLVLPAACVTNSRYLDNLKLKGIMQTLGYSKVREKLSAKLVYYLWQYNNTEEQPLKHGKKEQVRSGGSRNNFAIALPHTACSRPKECHSSAAKR